MQDRDEELILAVLNGPWPIVDPKLPDGWDDTDHNDRPEVHFLMWDVPYIVTHLSGYRVKVLNEGAWGRSQTLKTFPTMEAAVAEVGEDIRGPILQKWNDVRQV